MKNVFYTGLAGLALFEISRVYFVMPMPGSQQLDTIGIAYFLYSFRWWFRIAFSLLILIGIIPAFRVRHRWVPVLALLALSTVLYFFNFRMSADHMFLSPETLIFKGRADNTLDDSTVVLATAHGGEAKAYPLRFIVYHHQVRDLIGGKPVMVTYCSVCRTGRVFDPTVNGSLENFRLVGMDHFNAMFEDSGTGSWWQQSTGKAISGPLKGTSLAEIESIQVTLGKFFSLYPFGKVMQAEEASKPAYDSLGRFEKGKSRSSLTRTDSLSWKDKSWVIGITIGNHSRAYDWRKLATVRVINDRVGSTPVVVVISRDGQSFAAFERASPGQVFTVRNDTLVSDTLKLDFLGRDFRGVQQLRRVRAYQEFWHSWKTFHPETDTFSLH